MADPNTDLCDHYMRNGHPRLADSFVCLLDVLGTTAGTLEETEQFFRVTHSALCRAEECYEDPHTPALVRWFSDNAAVASPRLLYANVWGAEGASQLSGAGAIIVAASIQLQLSNLGLFVRGGMDVGPFFASRQFVYGPPLISAHQLESKIAVYPRVVLSPNCEAFVREQAGAPERGFPWDVYRNLVAIDDDGLLFINYLHLVSDEDDEEAMLLCHRDHVRNKRHNAKDERIRAKYEWAAEYHDRFCRDHLADHGRLDEFLDDQAGNGTLRHPG